MILSTKLTKTEQGVLEVLFLRHGKLTNQNQIAKTLGKPLATISKCVRSLQQKDLLQFSKNEENKQIRISINLDNAKQKQRKQVHNIASLYASGLIEKLGDCFAGCTIVLFGSYARGEDTHLSDIDIAIIGSTPRSHHWTTFEEKLLRKVSLHFYKKMDMHTHLKENICNGIVFRGGIRFDEFQ